MENQSSCHKFLITGGGGYIGFHIAKRLLQLKQEVILFDLNYPSRTWDSNLEYPLTTAGDDGMEELCCTDGKLKFVKGWFQVNPYLQYIKQEIIFMFLSLRWRKGQ